ncbi:restriction endonuclease subunit S [Thalassorhabdus alkalitolerans]|uniref:Restriction endonuclease subunit S n=1 Tax=Thalassorhabdus alkalitolerans TaxID=2282697 RepID=A0ABW0YNV7_9BACI
MNNSRRKIREICEVSSSKRIFMKDYVEEGTPFYRSKEIIKKHNGQEISDKLYISNEKFNEIKGKFGAPSHGDILLTSVGTIGVPYIVADGEEFYFKDGNLTWFKNFSSEVSNKYIYYWLQSPNGKREIDKQIIGSTQKALTIQSIKEMEIEIPPLEIQLKVVEILDNVTSKIELNLKMNYTLEEMAMILYKHWFINFSLFQDEDFVESEIGMIPEGWEVVSVSEFSNIIGGGTPKTSIEEYWGGEYPWISVKDLNSPVIMQTEKTVTEKGIKNSSTKLLPAFSTVISARGTIGNISMVGKEMTMNQSCYAFSSPDGFDTFTFLSIKKSINNLIKQSHGSVFNTITKSTVNSLKFPYEPNHIRSFEEKVKPFYQLIRSNIVENYNLDQLKDYLLPKLLSGEVDLCEADERVENIMQ